MKAILLFILVFFSFYAAAQQRRLISIDLVSKKIDTLNLPSFDTSVKAEKTPFNLGRHNSVYEDLVTQPPTENVYPQTNFTLKRQASKDFNLNNFPIRTTIKLYAWENGTPQNNCSGSMISRKHVLTATHCIIEHFKNSLFTDSLLVCPVVDNGKVSTIFECSWVKKVYFFENWNYFDTDFTVLELEKPLGEKTGWLSIGFEEDNASLLDGIFYKFSYPGITKLEIDSDNYNGDTLYYNYGIADLATDQSYGVRFAKGIPGESGSSLIKVENGKIYTSYGVFTFSGNLYHNRFTNWKYYAVNSIIKNDLELKEPEVAEDFDLDIFPNPTSQFLNITCPENYKLDKLTIFDIMGKKLLERNNLASKLQLDISSFAEGNYILIGYCGEKTVVKRIAKRNF